MFGTLFEGRRNRLSAFAISTILYLGWMAFLIFFSQLHFLPFSLRFILLALMFIAVLILMFSNGIKRVHDFNVSGAWYLKWQVPLVVLTFAFSYFNNADLGALAELATGIFNLYIFIKKGTDGPNDYGEALDNTSFVEDVKEAFSAVGGGVVFLLAILFSLAMQGISIILPVGVLYLLYKFFFD